MYDSKYYVTILKTDQLFSGAEVAGGASGRKGLTQKEHKGIWGADRNVLDLGHGRGDMTVCIYQTQNCTLKKLKCTQIMPQILKILELREQVCTPREMMTWTGGN